MAHTGFCHDAHTEFYMRHTHNTHKQACIVTLEGVLFFIVSVTPIQETLVFFKYFVYRGIVSSLSHPSYGDISGRIWTSLMEWLEIFENSLIMLIVSSSDEYGFCMKS